MRAIFPRRSPLETRKRWNVGRAASASITRDARADLLSATAEMFSLFVRVYTFFVGFLFPA